jgi:hypothetical protein
MASEHTASGGAPKSILRLVLHCHNLRRNIHHYQKMILNLLARRKKRSKAKSENESKIKEGIQGFPLLKRSVVSGEIETVTNTKPCDEDEFGDTTGIENSNHEFNGNFDSEHDDQTKC